MATTMGLVDRIRAVFRRSPPEPGRAALPEPAPAVAPELLGLAAVIDTMAHAPNRDAYEHAASTLAGFAKAADLLPSTPLTEAPGRPGFEVYGGWLAEKESSPDLSGQRKWTTYRNNLDNNGIVGAATRRYLEFLGAPTWRVPPKDAADPDAVLMAEFAEQQIAQLATPWRKVTQTAGMHRMNGSTIQVWTARPIAAGQFAGMIGLADIADRPMHTIERWEMTPDGKLLGVWQRVVHTAEVFFLSRDRMVWSQDVPITDSPAGLGLYRHIAEPCRELTALRKMSRQGFETDLAGIPVIYAPMAELKEKIGNPAYPGGPVFTATDYQAALQGVLTFADKHVRTKQTALIFDSGTQMIQGQPSQVPRFKFELAAAGGTAHAPVLEAMRDVRWEIATILGFEYLLLGASGAGSLAMAEAKTSDAYRLISGALNGWAEVVQRDVLGPLWALNGRDPEAAPLPTWDKTEFQELAKVVQGILSPLAAAGIVLDRRDEIVNAIITRTGLPGLAAPDEASLMIPGRPALLPRVTPDAGLTPPGTPGGSMVPTSSPAPVAKRKPIDFDEGA